MQTNKISSMPYNITCFNKILTLAIAPFLFILVGILCEFAMVPGVYILLSSQEEEMHSSTWGYRWTHSETNSSKKIYTFFYHYFTTPSLLLNWKNTNKELNCVMLMVLVVWRSSTLKFQFVFGFKECLWAIFSLIIFGKFFWFYTWLGIAWHDFWFCDTDNLKSPLTLHAHE